MCGSCIESVQTCGILTILYFYTYDLDKKVVFKRIPYYTKKEFFSTQKVLQITKQSEKFS